MNRRDFARVLGGSSAALLLAPSRLRADGRFALADGLIFMNAANLCPASVPVVEALQRWTSALDGDPSSATKAKLAQAKEETRGAVAKMLRAAPEEIVLTRPATQGRRRSDRL
jgi:selenocysteine lyase/cysteine desulfurase